MNVFLDANILFSASDRGGNMAIFVRFLSNKGVAVTSDYAAIEAERNVLSKRPGWHDGFKEIVRGITILPSVDGPVSVDIAAKDRPILATAMKAECDYLVTGDRKHFGHLFGTSVRKTQVATASMMREALRKLI